MGSQLLTAKEVAAQLSVTVNTLAIWRHRGKGPRWTTLGTRIIRYRASDVESFIKEGMASASEH